MWDVLAHNGFNYLSWSLDAEILISDKKSPKDNFTQQQRSGEGSHTAFSEASFKYYPEEWVHEWNKSKWFVGLPEEEIWEDWIYLTPKSRAWMAEPTLSRLRQLRNTMPHFIELSLAWSYVAWKLRIRTLSTFHLIGVSRIMWVTSTRKKNTRLMSKLSNALQQDQGWDETILHNHMSQPTVSIAPHEQNATSFQHNDRGEDQQKAPKKGKGKATKFNKNKKGKGKKTKGGK
jgi:hypothetical protein